MVKTEKAKNTNNKRKIEEEEEEEDWPMAKQENRAKKSRKSNKNNIVTDDRFKSVHFDPRFQRVPKKESKVSIDSRFNKLLSRNGFGSSKAAVDKRGRVKKESNNLSKYYVDEDAGRDKEKEVEKESGESEIGESSSSSSDDEEENDVDYGDESHLDLITQYLMARHEDTPSTDKETHRLAIVNMDWDHIKAVDLYVAISSCLPKGGQILSVGIYPSEHGLKCMEVEAVKGPFALIDNNEEHSEDESESDDENSRNEELRTYELNKLRYYHGVVVFDSSATANRVYKALDGTELLSTSNVFDLRFIPDSMEFKHHPRDMTTEAPTSYTEPDFHTRALQHSNVKLTWEDDEPRRTKVLRRKFNPDELDEVNEYLASSGEDSDAEESEGSENEDEGPLRKGEAKKHMDKEKLRALLLSGDGSGSDKDDVQDMEITFNTGLEDLSKRILEKKDRKSRTVWEQVLQKRSEKRKARKNRSKHSSDDDSDDSEVPEEETEQPDDFFVEEEPLDSKTKDSEKSKRGKNSRKERKESSDIIGKEQEASKAELELLFAEDQDGKGDGAKGYKLKPKKKFKGKKGKEALAEAKLPNVDPSEDPRFSALFNSHIYALDPTDPQFKRSAAYARQQLGKRKTVNKMEERAKEMMNAPEQVQTIGDDTVAIEKEKYELSSTVKSLKRNLGNLNKGTKSR